MRRYLESNGRKLREMELIFRMHNSIGLLFEMTKNRLGLRIPVKRPRCIVHRVGLICCCLLLLLLFTSLGELNYIDAVR